MASNMAVKEVGLKFIVEGVGNVDEMSSAFNELAIKAQDSLGKVQVSFKQVKDAEGNLVTEMHSGFVKAKIQTEEQLKQITDIIARFGGEKWRIKDVTPSNVTLFDEKQVKEDIKRYKDYLRGQAKDLEDTFKKRHEDIKRNQTVEATIVKNGADSVKAIEADAKRARVEAELRFNEKIQAARDKLANATYNPNLAMKNQQTAMEAAERRYNKEIEKINQVEASRKEALKQQQEAELARIRDEEIARKAALARQQAEYKFLEEKAREAEARKRAIIKETADEINKTLEGIRLIEAEEKRLAAEEKKQLEKRIAEEQKAADAIYKARQKALQAAFDEDTRLQNMRGVQNRNTIAQEEADQRAARARELAALRNAMQQRAALDIEQRNILASRFTNDLREQEAQFQHSIAYRTAAELNGINSVQARRLAAEETIRRAESTRQTILGSLAPRIAGGSLTPSAATDEATRANERYAESTRRARAELQRLNDVHEHTFNNMFVRSMELVGVYGLLHGAFNRLTSSISAVPKIGIELDATRASLEATMGSTAAASSAIAALDKEASRTGVTINVLRENFRNFQASTSLAGASLNSTWNMFTNLNTIITGLHLSADKANGVFIAMAQIFNKGKVQSEELVKQLGNLLPGAFASFAASMKIAPQELAKEMKAGTVFAKDTMEDFLQYMKERFAPAFAVASVGLNANIGRMETSFAHLAEAIYEKSSPALLSFTKNTTSLTDKVTEAIKDLDSFSTIFNVGVSVAIYGATAALTSGLIPAVKLLQSSLAFIISPVGIVAGITTIVASLATWETALDRVRKARETNEEINKEIENLRKKPTMTEAEQINLGVENDPTVVKLRDFTKNLKKDIDEVDRALADSRKKVASNPWVSLPALGDYLFTDAGKIRAKADEKYFKDKQMLEENLLRLEEVKVAKRKELEEGLANTKATVIEQESDARKRLANEIDALRTKQIKTEEEAAIHAEANFKKQNWSQIEETKAIKVAAERELRKISEKEAKGLSVEDKDKKVKKAQDDLTQYANMQAGLDEAMQEAITKAKEDFLQKKSNEEKKLAKEGKKGLAGDYANNLLEGKIGIEQNNAYLEKLRGQYKQGIIDAQNFYSAKRKAITDDLQIQQQALDKNIQAATLAKDTTAIRKYSKEKELLGAKAQTALAKASADEVETVSKAKTKLNAMYQDAVREGKLSAAENDAYIATIDGQFKRGEISILEYFAIKKKAVENDLKMQEQAIGEALRLAYQNKDTNAIKKYTDEQIKHTLKADTALAKLNEEEKTANLDKLRQIAELNAAYEEYLGNYVKAAAIREEIANKQADRKYSDKADQEKADILAASAAAGERLAGYTQEMASADAKYNQSMLRTNTLLNLGAISKLEALRRETAANKELIAMKEKQIQLALQEKNLSQKDKNNLQREQADLEKLKMEGDATANYFKTNVRQAFDSSFAGVITGTQTASAAFSSFAQNIIMDMGKILAEEIRVKLIEKALGLLLDGIGGGFGSLFGKGTSSTGSGFSGSNLSTMSKAISPTFKSEKGNVFQFAKGGIPDIGNKLQYFPMANGGIGSLRENGYEAIMPLARDSSGKLGVSLQGKGDSTGQINNNVYNINVNVQSNGKEGASQQGQIIATAVMRSIAKEEVYKASRNTNVKNKMTM